MKFSSVLAVSVAVAFAAGCAWLLASTRAVPAVPAASPYDAASLGTFASCLADRGATMYGAVWCPHCQKQKADFGAAFKSVKYVECSSGPDRSSPQAAACAAQGITGYPTWTFKDGTRVGGEVPFAVLAAKTGCPAPAFATGSALTGSDSRP